MGSLPNQWRLSDMRVAIEGREILGHRVEPLNRHSLTPSQGALSFRAKRSNLVDTERPRLHKITSLCVQLPPPPNPPARRAAPSQHREGAKLASGRAQPSASSI